MRGWRFSSARPSARPSKLGASIVEEGRVRRLDGDRAQLDAGRCRRAPRRRCGVPSEEKRLGIDTACTCSGAEGVGGDHGDERRVDAAGQPDHDVGEAVLGDVVAGGEHRARRTPRRRGRAAASTRAGGAGSGWPATGPEHGRRREGPRRCRGPRGSSRRVRNTGAHVEVDDLHASRELRRAGDEIAVVVDHERGAVEDQLVLAADLVHVDDVAVGVLGAGGDHPLALGVAALEVRRAVGVDDRARRRRPPARRSGRPGSRRPRRSRCRPSRRRPRTA